MYENLKYGIDLNGFKMGRRIDEFRLKRIIRSIGGDEKAEYKINRQMIKETRLEVRLCADAWRIFRQLVLLAQHTPKLKRIMGKHIGVSLGDKANEHHTNLGEKLRKRKLVLSGILKQLRKVLLLEGYQERKEATRKTREKGELYEEKQSLSELDMQLRLHKMKKEENLLKDVEKGAVVLGELSEETRADISREAAFLVAAIKLVDGAQKLAEINDFLSGDELMHRLYNSLKEKSSLLRKDEELIRKEIDVSERTILSFGLFRFNIFRLTQDGKKEHKFGLGGYSPGHIRI